MKKFKIIEQSRFVRNGNEPLKTNEMDSIHGGSIITCNPSSPYTSCSIVPQPSYITCKPAAAAVGFNMGDCNGPYLSCGADMQYKMSNCYGIPLIFTTSCPAGTNFGN